MLSYVIRVTGTRERWTALEICKRLLCPRIRWYTAGSTDRLQDVLFDLCQRRHFILGDKLTATSLLRGFHSLGPLGIELKKNLINEWWSMVLLKREQVLAIDTLNHLSGESASSTKPLLRICPESWLELLQKRDLTKDQLVALLKEHVGELGALRQDLLYGGLLHYVSCLELVNRKLPFGIAEVGLVRERWLHSLGSVLQKHQFSQVPSRFSSDHQDNMSVIHYHFPWGKEPVESLCCMDEASLTQMHCGGSAKLHGRDGRKSVIPHVVWVSGDLDRGLLAYLSDALQLTENQLSRGKDQQRMVLKIHPSLAPIKVAVDLGKGPAVDLRLVCQGLSDELRESRISVWPGYLDTLQTPMEQLFTKYDEMGVMFTVLVSDITLENGLLQLRSRDTTIKETMHISKLRDFLLQYITATKKH
ncbi:DNA polymerase subunit gamma-2, mitochondrial isoform X3 [Pseudophryne corroboree]|uniref:DNA polymerase subunit gamma-2, mitochondrial isoform X3 n=1 Tax=Pseudophryne corroboree TaxID=495146 RepID=UPI003081AF9E